MRRTAVILSLLTIVASLLPTGVAIAQRTSDEDFYTRDRSEEDPGRNVAGVFDYYALVMSWSPTHCSERSDRAFDPQCDRNDGRRYAFVLHGLWPQYEKGYPGNCRTRRKPYVPQPIIDKMLDIMPSPRLVIHEFRKHGTCSGLDPAGYYEMSRKLFRSIKIPERYVNPFEAQFVGVEELEREFLRANPQLNADMISIACGGGGSRLKELRICFTKEGKPRSCGVNEEQRRLCSANKMFLPPVRSSKVEPDTAADLEKLKESPTARPRVIESLR